MIGALGAACAPTPANCNWLLNLHLWPFFLFLLEIRLNWTKRTLVPIYRRQTKNIEPVCQGMNLVSLSLLTASHF